MSKTCANQNSKMAKPNMNIFTSLAVIVTFLFFENVTCAYSSIAKTNYHISQNIGQNLTEAIDKVLQDDDSSKYKAVLKEGLNWSLLVYYETDILLDDIEDIIAVVDLLNESKPDHIPHPKIILSLNYLNKSNGHFLWPRMADVYYNMSKNISSKNKSRILNSLVAIVTNFVSPVYWHSEYSFTSGYCPTKEFFTNYIKEYVDLYFGENWIPVGLIYSDSFPAGCQPQNNFLVDDLIYYLEIEFTRNFPIFMDQFSKYIDKALQKTRKSTTIFVSSKVPVTFVYIWKRYPYNSGTIKTAAYATMKNQNITQIFTKKIYQTAGVLLNHMILSWASLKSRNVILGNLMQNVSSEVFTKTESRSKNILPYVYERNAVGGFCEVEVMLSEISRKFVTILLDEQSWRTLARYQIGKKGRQLNCNRSSKNNETECLKVLTHFTDETEMHWVHMEELISRLLVAYPKIGHMKLDTIIFKEELLEKSTQIQNFVNSARLKHKLGCSIVYSKVESALYRASSGSNISENDFKTVLENNLCPPVFHLVKLMIWLAPEYEKTGALFSYYSDLFLAREIFLAHFPNITVLVQFSSSINTDYRVLADIYNVPIVVT